MFQIRARNQLRVNGLNFRLYFGSFFFVLGTMLLCLLGILLILVAAFNFKALLIPAAFGILTSMFVIYIIPGLLYIGSISYLFDNIESGQFIFAFARYIGYFRELFVHGNHWFSVGLVWFPTLLWCWQTLSKFSMGI